MMYDPRYYQNPMPQQNTYQPPYSGQQYNMPNYVNPADNSLPQNSQFFLPNQMQQPAVQQLPNPSAQYQGQQYPVQRFKKGGVAHSQDYFSMAEALRRQGKNGDTILAHINPEEAALLQGLSGNGTPNPDTGLPQFGLFDKPGKWLKSNLGGLGGAILGNMIMPGIGGLLGGGLGGALNSAARGRKDYMQSALRGAGIGGMLPTLSGWAGSAANSLGYSGLGNTLTDYGNANAIFPAFDRTLGTNLAGGNMATNAGVAAGLGQVGGGAGGGAQTQIPVNVAQGDPTANMGFLDKLKYKSSNFLSEPQNLLTLAVLGSAYANQKKPKTPEQEAAEIKRKKRASRLTPVEMAEREAYKTAKAQSNRRIARNQFIPEERFSIEPLYRRTNSPEEYEQEKRWFNYYNNPQFAGQPQVFKRGGSVHNPYGHVEEIEINFPHGIGQMLSGEYIDGHTGGQDDHIPARLSDGEYVSNAHFISALGDGNNAAGVRKMKQFERMVLKDKFGTNKFPKKSKPLTSYWEALA